MGWRGGPHCRRAWRGWNPGLSPAGLMLRARAVRCIRVIQGRGPLSSVPWRSIHVVCFHPSCPLLGVFCSLLYPLHLENCLVNQALNWIFVGWMNSANKEIQLCNTPTRNGYFFKKKCIFYWRSPRKTRKVVHMETSDDAPGSSSSHPWSLFLPLLLPQNPIYHPSVSISAQLMESIRQKPKPWGWQNK